MCLVCDRRETMSFSSSKMQEGFSRHRLSEPEIFTFDPIPVVQVNPLPPRQRVKRRTKKVLYPARVRKYLPVEKRDTAKTILMTLLAVVLFQIYSAPELQDCSELMVPGCGEEVESVALPWSPALLLEQPEEKMALLEAFSSAQEGPASQDVANVSQEVPSGNDPGQDELIPTLSEESFAILDVSDYFLKMQVNS
ncbi:radiation-inducible immediate-early gene IEX-1 [Latimeria chalumnae]|uniref:radiation-inducible immediate-early gene IEX-1 n=1 Tax=Latimeria chalumnae TaxID=7897 RepID=UPI0006D912E1|nr:PREDICTED: radiation-inducible immediate-early gene IEX-1 [Latimeria chalumnae]|eukprot:XP_014345218.1 PREDICTED: radiation-inducible immediate-early gene IEX-1 [Latimeria chalumnae]